jgi:Protein of unknown function (DUF3261)
VKLRSAGLMALAFALSACSLRPYPLKPWPMPGPAAGPIRGNWLQTVRLERGGRELSLLAVIECDGTALTLAGLTPAGQRLVRIDWREGRIEQESDPNLPAKVDGEGILRDLVLAYWPQAALDSALAGTEWSIAYAKGTRTLSARGQARIAVAPESAGVSGAAAGEALRIRHFREGYEVRVATVERTAP